MAVVAIRAVTGDGILGKAKEGANEYEQSKQKENDVLSGYALTLAQASGKAWKQSADGKSVTKGKQTLKVGETVGSSGVSGVDYTVNGTLPTLPSGNSWKVLGEENGNLLLMTASNLSSVGFNGATASLWNAETKRYDGCVTELNNKCKELINIEGTKATNVRSVTVEDINRVTGYDPEHTGLAHDKGPYNSGQISQYNNTVTYTKNSSEISYTSSAKSGTSNESNFYKPTDKTNLCNGESYAVTSDYYYYNPETLTNSGGTKPEEQAWYNLLFTNTSSSYWLASPSACAGEGLVSFGIRIVLSGRVNINYLWYSRSGASSSSCGVRAVASLSSDIVVQ